MYGSKVFLRIGRFFFRKKMDSTAIMIDDRFNEFKQKSLFIDCIFTSWNKPEIKAHRIVLSKHSTVFKQYFDKHPFSPSQIKMNIPFNTSDHSFAKIIHFFYNKSIELTKENIIIMLAHAVIYDIRTLQQIILDVISDYVNKSSVVNFMRQIISISISADACSKFPGIEQNYERYLYSIDFLANYIAINFTVDELYQTFDCFNPRILSMILKHSMIPSSVKVKIINDFVKNSVITQQDMIFLTYIIDWEPPDSYLYLVKCDCNWVLPKVSRQLYSKIITQRRISAKSFETKINSLSDTQVVPNTENKAPRKFQNWFPFAWITLVADSEGKTQTPEVELSEYIGTLGGLVKFFNPVSYYLLESLTSPPMHHKNFSDAYLFEDSPKYFLTCGNQPKFIGFKMRIPCFKLKSILVSFDNRERGKPMEPNTKLMYPELGKMKLLVSDINGKTKFPNPVIPGVKFDCMQTPVSFICVIPDTHPENTQRCLRVSRLKSFGSFDVD